MSKPRLIAFYLPQFYPTPENDEWWGKGFTEWTNVGRAKPLFKGHYQPRVPADLGYYDLRIPEIRMQQAELAKEAGIEGFCYWHYWFAGRRLLDRVFNEVLKTGDPDYPFCLGWANHSWYAKTWDKDVPDKMLCEQTYLGQKDYLAHFEYVLTAFKDKRYLTHDGKPIFYVFDPLSLPDDFIPYWTELAIKNGFSGIYFVARLMPNVKKEDVKKKGFSAVVPERIGEAYGHNPPMVRLIHRIIKTITFKPKFAYSYKYASRFFIKKEDAAEDVIPQIIPQWDHSPRSGKRGTILYGSTPKLFGEHVMQVMRLVEKKKNKVIFLKSWN